jgi:hypothetical protein
MSDIAAKEHRPAMAENIRELDNQFQTMIQIVGDDTCCLSYDLEVLLALGHSAPWTDEERRKAARLIMEAGREVQTRKDVYRPSTTGYNTVETQAVLESFLNRDLAAIRKVYVSLVSGKSRNAALT